MQPSFSALITSLVVGLSTVGAQPVDPLKNALQPVNVSMVATEVMGRSAVRVIKSPSVTAFDEATFVKLVGMDFRNGTIEVDVVSRLQPDAPDFARGFIGVAFRISADNSRFESIYLRPTNARADDQVRRNRSTQYFSYPEFKFDRLRREAPGKYESYANLALNEWINLRIVVQDNRAQLYVNQGKQPVLVVTDLKHGASASGAIGLWVDVGTEGYFSNLRIFPP